MKINLALSFALFIYSLPFSSSAQEMPIEDIRKDYYEISALIEEVKKGYETNGRGNGLYANQILLNNYNGSWRASGNYRIKVSFWYEEAPAFMEAYGEDTPPEAGLRRIVWQSEVSAAQIKKEFHFYQGKLVFYFEKTEADIRIYFDQNKWLRLIWNGRQVDASEKLSPMEKEQIQRVKKEAQGLQKIYLSTFDLER